MSSNCPECGGITTWDDSVGSAVCTSCGTLTDPSQSILTSHYDFPERTSQYSGWGINSTRRIHFSSWALADQGKEARDKRNSVAILEFIESLARSLNATGLSPRAMRLFLQAKEAAQFRWGRKAKLVAGVCLAIALRESNRPDCLRDIAYLLEEPFPTLSRVFISITSALKLSLSRVETSSYIPILREHTSSLLKELSASLPATLARDLSSVSLQAASNTASSLSDIFARIGAPPTQSPGPPVACALFILALESELRTTIKHLAPFAQAIGRRLDVGKGSVMTCYKVKQDALASLAENVPWLDKYETKNGRARVAKRNVVARATKDIIAFYNNNWKTTAKPKLDIISEDNTHSQDQGELVDSGDHNVPPKRRKVQHKAAMQFLLDPVTGPLPSYTQLPSHTTSTCTPQQLIHPLLAHYLSAQQTSQEPTRLQLLAAARGGADHISDSELFEEDEIESLMRNEEEMNVIAHMYDWGDEEEVSVTKTPVTATPRTSSKKHRYQHQRQQEQELRPEERRGRINLDALAEFMEDSESMQDDHQAFSGLFDAEYRSNSADEPDSSEAEAESTPPPPHEIRVSPPAPRLFTDEIIIADWRPTSPGHGAIIDNRYYEDYD